MKKIKLLTTLGLLILVSGCASSGHISTGVIVSEPVYYGPVYVDPFWYPHYYHPPIVIYAPPSHHRHISPPVCRPTPVIKPHPMVRPPTIHRSQPPIQRHTR